jgi:hypothetical protein
MDQRRLLSRCGSGTFTTEWPTPTTIRPVGGAASLPERGSWLRCVVPSTMLDRRPQATGPP